jgi:succinyl-diaminopimelate desuccinylase
MEQERKVEILQDVIRIQSVNGNEEEVAKYFQELLKEYDIESELVPWKEEGRSSLVATLKKGEGKVLGISGHMDVVAAGDESQWKYPPFDAHIEDNKLYGRGSTDMKAGTTALVLTMIEMKEEEIPFEGTLKLLLTVGEEVGQHGATQLTAQGYADDLDALLIAEPTNFNIGYIHKGSMDYTVVSHGKASHSSMPEEGINAITQINEFITEINKEMGHISETYENEILGKFIHNITLMSGGTQINSIPEKAQVQGNIRTIPEFSNDETIELLEQVISRINRDIEGELELVIDNNKYPVTSDPDSEIIQKIQEQMDERLPLIGMSATTDAAEFTRSKNHFDVVIFGPGIPTLPHQLNEYVEVDNYLEFIDVYKKVFPAYLSAN